MNNRFKSLQLRQVYHRLLWQLALLLDQLRKAFVAAVLDWLRQMKAS